MKKLTINVTEEHIKKGLTGHCKQCPVALAILDHSEFILQPEEYFLVWPMSVMVKKRATPDEAIVVKTIPLPLTVLHFITAFDKGREVKPFSFEIEI